MWVTKQLTVTIDFHSYRQLFGWQNFSFWVKSESYINMVTALNVVCIAKNGYLPQYFVFNFCFPLQIYIYIYIIFIFIFTWDEKWQKKNIGFHDLSEPVG